MSLHSSLTGNAVGGLLPQSSWVALHLLQDELHGRVPQNLLHFRIIHGSLPPCLWVILFKSVL